MIALTILCLVACSLFLGLNSVLAEYLHQRLIYGVGILILAFFGGFMMRELSYDSPSTNYYLNHQDEFVVDTISVNGVVTELKIRKK